MFVQDVLIGGWWCFIIELKKTPLPMQSLYRVEELKSGVALSEVAFIDIELFLIK